MLKTVERDNIDLLMTDTDSLCYHIRKQDIFEIMNNNRSIFDLSNYDKSSFLYDNTKSSNCLFNSTSLCCVENIPEECSSNSSNEDAFVSKKNFIKSISSFLIPESFEIFMSCLFIDYYI